MKQNNNKTLCTMFLQTAFEKFYLRNTRKVNITKFLILIFFWGGGLYLYKLLKLAFSLRYIHLWIYFSNILLDLFSLPRHQKSMKSYSWKGSRNISIKARDYFSHKQMWEKKVWASKLQRQYAFGKSTMTK